MPIAIFSRTTSLLMVLIALTRYAKIVHPNLFRCIFTKTNTIMIMTCIWCVGITMPSLSVHGKWGKMDYYNTTGLCAISYQPNQSLANITFLITSISCNYYLPLVVICLCYISISRANTQSQRNILSHSQQSRLGSISSVSRLLRKADTLQLHTSISIICIIYLISYAPYIICHTIQLAGLITIDSYQKNFLLVFMSINSFSNPVIFTIIRCKARKQQMIKSGTIHSFKTTYLSDNIKTFSDIRSVVASSRIV